MIHWMSIKTPKIKFVRGRLHINSSVCFTYVADTFTRGLRASRKSIGSVVAEADVWNELLQPNDSTY